MSWGLNFTFVEVTEQKLVENRINIMCRVSVKKPLQFFNSVQFPVKLSIPQKEKLSA